MNIFFNMVIALIFHLHVLYCDVLFSMHFGAIYKMKYSIRSLKFSIGIPNPLRAHIKVKVPYTNKYFLFVDELCLIFS